MQDTSAMKFSSCNDARTEHGDDGALMMLESPELFCFGPSSMPTMRWTCEIHGYTATVNTDVGQLTLTCQL